MRAPELRNSQQGDNYTVVTTEIPEYRSTISIDYKTPEVLFEHGGIDGLQKKYVPRIKAKSR